MTRIKQTKKGWVSVEKLPSGRYQSTAFLESRLNPIQEVSNTKIMAMKKARRMVKKYL